MRYIIERLKDVALLKEFRCGIPSMDLFIQEGIELSIINHYCTAYLLRDIDYSNILGLFALSFASLDLDIDDKNEVVSGVSSTDRPLLTDNYKDVFLNKPHYPALEISYLAVDRKFHHQGIGAIIVEAVMQKAQEQELAGCQFLTVEALATNDYSAVGFYNKCGFSPCEYPNPNKGTLRMFRTLYPD